MSIMTPWFQAFKGMNTPSVNVSGSGSIRVHWNALKMGGGGSIFKRHHRSALYDPDAAAAADA